MLDGHRATRCATTNPIARKVLKVGWLFKSYDFSSYSLPNSIEDIRTLKQTASPVCTGVVRLGLTDSVKNNNPGDIEQF